METKKLIHYTKGYGGELNYHTICGKEIHSHSDTENATIDPREVDCTECMKTEKWIEDHGHATGETKTDIPRRIYIESDILSESELISAKRSVRYICEDKDLEYIPNVFAEALDYAWHDLEKTWGAVKKADEIYASTSLIPLTGGSYSGAPVIFNGMCERAVKENVTGKSIYILNELGNIDWGMIDIDVMKKAFKDNKLFMYDEDYENMIEVNIEDIKG